jgi:hypothetical protein
MSPISAREGHRSKLAAQTPDGKTARRPATGHGDGGPHAKARDDKPERRFSGRLSAMTGASASRTHHTDVAARVAGLKPSSNFSRGSTGVRQGLLCEYPPLKLTHYPSLDILRISRRTLVRKKLFRAVGSPGWGPSPFRCAVVCFERPRAVIRWRAYRARRRSVMSRLRTGATIIHIEPLVP